MPPTSQGTLAKRFEPCLIYANRKGTACAPIPISGQCRGHGLAVAKPSAPSSTGCCTARPGVDPGPWGARAFLVGRNPGGGHGGVDDGGHAGAPAPAIVPPGGQLVRGSGRRPLVRSEYQATCPQRVCRPRRCMPPRRATGTIRVTGVSPRGVVALPPAVTRTRSAESRVLTSPVLISVCGIGSGREFTRHDNVGQGLADCRNEADNVPRPENQKRLTRGRSFLSLRTENLFRPFLRPVGV